MKAKPESERLGVAGLLCAILAVGFVASAVYTSAIGTIPFTYHRAAALVVSASIALLGGYGLATLYPLQKPGLRWGMVAFDTALLILLAIASFRFLSVLEKIQYQFYRPDTIDVVWAFLGLAVILEIGRRIWGLPLLVVCLVFLSYLVFGHQLPTTFGHRFLDWSSLSVIIWYGYQGVFSTILGIVLNIVIIFVLFGCLLESTGAGRSLIKFAVALTGRLKGGPAYAAIFSSSLFGTMSGSTIANVVGTGTFTIPLIKERGFKPTFAAGIEATASSGGQIVPPIMGAAAFVMADVIGVSYLTIVMAALVPAFLYYANLVFGVYFEARKQNIQPLAREDLPKLERKDYFAALQFLIPIATVIYVLISGRSVAFSGFAACVAVIVVGLIVDPELRRQPSRILKGAINAGKSAPGVVIAVAMIGVIIGTMDSTGSGLKFASFIGWLGEGSLPLSLVLAMLGSLLLGMGMPTLAAYLVIALILGPAIEQMGVSILSAHLFVFYYGVASSITPPVALAAYAAAPIAGSDPFRTGLMAVRLGMAKFLVPFVFIYNPVLLLVETFEPVTFVVTLLRSLVGFWLLSSALAGYDRVKLRWWETLARAIAGLLLLTIWSHWQAAGLIVGLSAIVFHVYAARRVQPADPNDAVASSKR